MNSQETIIKAETGDQAEEKRKKKLYLGILQEEAAEVIQAVSKINRFGLLSTNPYSQKTNKESLCSEMGDVLAMIELVSELSSIHISKEELEEAKQHKLTKMAFWLNQNISKLD